MPKKKSEVEKKFMGVNILFLFVWGGNFKMLQLLEEAFVKVKKFCNCRKLIIRMVAVCLRLIAFGLEPSQKI